jgi:glycosyltransferase involved in cell wall biosynthesis
MGDLPISVIVVAKNAEKTIGDCLKSVQRNNSAEIIVVDGNSTDRTLEITRKYTERIFNDGGRGLNYARQLGAEQATQVYIAYVDSDVVLSDGAMVTMLADLQGSEYVSMLAQEVTDAKYSSYWQRAQYQHNQFRNAEGHLGTVASLLRRETVLKYGFDLSERDLDDADLELRMRREGCRFGISSAQYYHRYRMDFKSLAMYRFFIGRVGARYIRKYGPWHAGFWPPLSMLYWLGFSLIKGKPALIPYFLVEGVAKTAGMVKGFFELIGEALRKTNP